MRQELWFGVALLVLATGCGSDDPGDEGSGGGWTPSNPARCGLASYKWLPADQVGGVLEKNLALDVPQTQIQSLVTLAAGTTKISHPMNHAVSIYVIRYQTQDQGELVDATAMVGIPSVTAPTSLPVLAFLHGTAGFDDGCAPSLGAGDITKSSTVVSAVLSSAGYVTVLPDYIGMKSLGGPSQRSHPYLVAEATAIASLDAIRAAKQLVADVASSITPEGLVIAGHSQGGHATEVTTRFAPFYAPELAIAGAAPIAAPTDLVGAFSGALHQTANPAYWALGVAWAYMADTYYGGNALDKALVPPWDVQAKDVALGRCSPGYQDPLIGVTDVNALVKPEMIAAIDAGGEGYDPWSCYVLENSLVSMPVPIDQTPTLYVLGEKDPLVVPEPQRSAFDALCAKGAKLAYLECAGADHGQAFYYSVDDVLDFFSARLAGEPMPDAVCQRGAAATCKSTP